MTVAPPLIEARRVSMSQTRSRTTPSRSPTLRTSCAGAGIDALPGLDGGRQAVADGKLDATFVYPIGGRQAVELVARILSGERAPRKVVFPTEKITRENALR